VITDNKAFKTSDRLQWTSKGFYIVKHSENLCSDCAYQQYSPWRQRPLAAQQKVSNTDIISSKALESLDLCTTLRLLYYTISQVPAPHYGHLLTISRYTETTTWLKPVHTRCSTTKLHQMLVTPSQVLIFMLPTIVNEKPPPQSTPYRVYSILISLMLTWWWPM
jgi:hypothetical protein